MVTFVRSFSWPPESPVMREMFQARKRVFVDLLKWDVPVLEGRFEVDQFDDPHAVYLIVTDRAGRHAGSARLLKTTRPHILDSLFPQLCAGDPPRHPKILEITRFCLSPGMTAAVRREIRNLLVSSLVDYALDNDIHGYTGVAEMGWLQQVLAFGWHCLPLGLPQAVAGRMLGALAIAITAETPKLLAASGVYRPVRLDNAAMLEAA